MAQPTDKRCPVPLCVVSELLLADQDMGERVFAVETTKALKRATPTLALACTSSDEAHPVADVALRCGRSFLSLKLLRELRAARPGAIIYIPRASLTAATFARAIVLRSLSGAAVTMTALQPYPISRTTRLLARAARLRALAVSPGMVETVAAGLPGVAVEALPLAVDQQRFSPADEGRRRALRLERGISEDDRVYLHVGHLKESRGVQVLGRLASEPGSVAVMIASTATRLEEALARTLRASGVRVETGYIDRIEDWYRCADCYVFPVRAADGCIDAPASVLEAMATDLPVVATRFGALGRLFSAREGFAFADDEEALLAAAGALALCDRPRTREMLSGMTWDAVASRLAALAGVVGDGQS